MPKTHILTATAFILGVCLLFSNSLIGFPIPTPVQKEATMSHHATGTFEVKVTPQPLADPSADKTLGRMSLEKQFHGDLEGTSKGEMLTAGTVEKGSAGYVAIE